MRTLIKGGTICLEGEVFDGDLLISNGKIELLTKEYQGEYDQLVDANGMYVCPGGVDAHTHMSLQQSPKYRACDDFYDGGVAAACGGTTTIIDHMGFGPNGCSLSSRFEEYKKLASACPIDYSFHGVFQHIDEAILEEMRGLIHDKGFNSFKAYTTYGFPMLDRDLLRIMQVVQEENAILTVHAENDAITNLLKEKYGKEGGLSPIYQAYSRPSEAEAEAEAVSRLAHLAKVANDANLYIVHLSAKESLEEVYKARSYGQKNILVETCTQYLLLTQEKFVEGGASEGIKYILSPPFRKKEDNERLWKGLANGEIQVVATDHCPFTEEEKQVHTEDYRYCPGGISGVEERMPLLFSEGVLKGRISLERFVQVTATNPAKIFGLYPRKGSLLPGADADIILIDPRRSRMIKKENLRTKAGYSAYENIMVSCVIDKVFLRGELIADNNTFCGRAGMGQLVKRGEPILENVQ